MAVKVMQSQAFADDDGSYNSFQQEVKVRLSAFECSHAEALRPCAGAACFTCNVVTCGSAHLDSTGVSSAHFKCFFELQHSSCGLVILE